MYQGVFPGLVLILERRDMKNEAIKMPFFFGGTTLYFGFQKKDKYFWGSLQKGMLGKEGSLHVMICRGAELLAWD